MMPLCHSGEGGALPLRTANIELKFDFVPIFRYYIFMIGIYKIENKLNHKCYIGQSVNIERRWSEHKVKSKISNGILYNAIRKNGLENFDFSIICECKVEELDEKEIYYIQQYNSLIPNGYNIQLGGNTSKIAPSEKELSIIEDIISSDLTFDEIGNKYNLSRRTIIRINQGDTWYNNSYLYPLRKRTKNIYYCPICGEEKSKDSKICKKCYKLMYCASDKPDRDTLKQLIRTVPFTQIGKKYNISDNAVRKWCDSYKLPRTKTLINTYTDEQWKLI